MSTREKEESTAHFIMHRYILDAKNRNLDKKYNITKHKDKRNKIYNTSIIVT